MTPHSNDPEICPNCGHGSTERLFVDSTSLSHIEVVMGCNDCTTEYVLSYGKPVVEDVIQHE